MRLTPAPSDRRARMTSDLFSLYQFLIHISYKLVLPEGELIR